jgi:hypothetical protein
MSTFDDQTDFSFLSVAQDEPVKAQKGKPRSVKMGNSIVTITVKRVVSDETRAKQRAAKLGRIFRHSAESKAKIAAANKNRVYSTGQKHSAETRAKMSASHKGRIISAETRAKMSAAAKGRPCSAETTAKINATKKGRPGPAPRPVMTPMGFYPNIREAAQAVGVSDTTIHNRIHTKPNHYYYIISDPFGYLLRNVK